MKPTTKAILTVHLLRLARTPDECVRGSSYRLQVAQSLRIDRMGRDARKSAATLQRYHRVAGL